MIHHPSSRSFTPTARIPVDSTVTHFPTTTSNLKDLHRTRAAIEHGIEHGLHLGAQLYLSRDCQPTESGEREGFEMVVGERSPGEPMTPETLMLWLSASKPVAAVALAQLWERGLLDLDDPVASYLPAFGVRGKEVITLRQVLTHTGGFRMLSVGWPEASWDEIIATICAGRLEPRWAPGEKAGYHLAASWFVLGEVVRQIDGRHYSHYVREEIFEPLGMLNSWVGMPLEVFQAEESRLGKMYSTEKEGPPMLRSWHRELHVVGCSPGGNGRGPMRELGRFYEMLLNRGHGPEGKILTAQSVEALTTPNRVGMHDHTFKHKLDWGLGFIVNSEHYGAAMPPYGYGRHASRRTFGHSGFQSSVAFADPKHRLVVAVVVNGNPGEPRHTERFRRLIEAIYEDLGLV
jgi:CubicO group peptidase (beta-lactamase class C family)